MASLFASKCNKVKRLGRQFPPGQNPMQKPRWIGEWLLRSDLGGDMHTPQIIVDGRNSEGKRISVSIDEALWTLYIASRGFCTQRARRDIKQRIASGASRNTYDVKRWIYHEIANPALISAAEDLMQYTALPSSSKETGAA